ncbi:MAG: hypothetical protein GVY16_11615 [Planctomycetes bacterium]|nr:hypothetical protein [Planctomycetota bacterium]
MATNHLEQLISEWYQYQGYFVRRNVQVGKRKAGGYECELDIVAFHPQTKHLVHIEPSIDGHSWARREQRYRKKFRAGKKYIASLFKGLNIPTTVEQIALFIAGSSGKHPTLAGGKVVIVKEILRDMACKLPGIHERVVPEQYPLLRTIQFVAQYHDTIWGEV